MTKEDKFAYIQIISHCSSFILLIIMGLSISHRIAAISIDRIGAIENSTSTQILTQLSTIKNLKDIVDDHGFQGWQMPCNYYAGSNADWDDKAQRYGDQKYLECANGLVYQKIGESPFTSYFNPESTQVNKKFCPKGGYALFSGKDPIASSSGGEFKGCVE